MSLRLITIPMSHYCDKARWALEYAGFVYEEERHLQGFHRLATRRAGGRSVPLLVTPEGPLTDSADIVAWIDEGLPLSRRLRTPEATGWERRLGQELGPAARLWAYDRVASERDLAQRYGLVGVPWWQRIGFPLAYRPLMAMIRRYLNWNDATVAQALDVVERHFDEVADQLSDGRPFLCGDRFTVADLTFATMAAAVVLPREYGIALPQPPELPPRAAAELSQWRAHAAGAFALRLYRDHRPTRPARAVR